MEALKAASKENTRAIYFETPTNPMMHITDIRAVAEFAHQAGATLGPFDSWLCLRGLKTLALRMERHKSNAEAVSRWLREQSVVTNVYYAGSGMISFTVTSSEIAVAILKNIRLITFAESLGGTESLLTYPAVQTHPDVPREQREKLGITDTLLRLSVGIENPDDIIADLKQAFENAEK